MTGYLIHGFRDVGSLFSGFLSLMGNLILNDDFFFIQAGNHFLFYRHETSDSGKTFK